MPASSNAAEARQVSSGAPLFYFSWTRDGQMVVRSDTNAGFSLLNPQSSGKTPLFEHDGALVDISFACSDGRYLIFSGIFSKGNNVLDIWRTDMSGGNFKQLSNGKVDQNPVCSHDGRWVFYQDEVNGDRIMKISIDGGTPQQISDELAAAYDVSPDGKTIAIATFGHLGEHVESLTLLSADSNQVLKTMAFEHSRSGPLRFSPDGKALVYPDRHSGVDNLWSQPLDGSSGKQLTGFNAEQIIDFHWSFDGKQLGVIRGHTDSDVVLIRDSQS
jgi:Tol biopolymer transport system component